MSKHKMKSFERKADIMHKSFNITIYRCDTFEILILGTSKFCGFILLTTTVRQNNERTYPGIEKLRY